MGNPPCSHTPNIENSENYFYEVEPPSKGIAVSPEYANLHDFLIQIAKLDVPLNEQSIHVNAWVLSNRGYKIEELTEAEYQELSKLMEGTAEAEMDDLVLHDFGQPSKSI